MFTNNEPDDKKPNDGIWAMDANGNLFYVGLAGSVRLDIVPDFDPYPEPEE